MNYRHAFHAGNAADVLKHALLARVLTHLVRKDAAVRVIDTHAGIGRYDLAGGEAERTKEWRDGIGRLWDAPPREPLGNMLEPFLSVVREMNPGGGLRHYPGSPEIARRLTRPQDRLALCELHPEDHDALRRAMGRDRRAAVTAIDGWTALQAYVPPKERRGLVLIDPPFEQPGEFGRLREGLRRAHAKWPTGSYMLWYPVKNPLDTDAFAADIARLALPATLRAELWTRRPNDHARLNGSGIILINPPWTLEAELRSALPALAEVLAQDEGARARVEWLAEAP
jgi:23S rRNA (adenine2030-N6)-methyltransferase